MSEKKNVFLVIADLMSDEGENTEYDRACVEVAGALSGFDVQNPSERSIVEQFLRVARNGFPEDYTERFDNKG